MTSAVIQLPNLNQHQSRTANFAVNTCMLLTQMFNPLLGGRRPADTSPRADGKAAASRFDRSFSTLATWSCNVPILVGSAPLLTALLECRLLLGLCIALAGRCFALNLTLADWSSPPALGLLYVRYALGRWTSAAALLGCTAAILSPDSCLAAACRALMALPARCRCSICQHCCMSSQVQCCMMHCWWWGGM